MKWYIFCIVLWLFDIYLILFQYSKVDKSDKNLKSSVNFTEVNIFLSPTIHIQLAFLVGVIIISSYSTFFRMLQCKKKHHIVLYHGVKYYVTFRIMGHNWTIKVHPISNEIGIFQKHNENTDKKTVVSWDVNEFLNEHFHFSSLATFSCDENTISWLFLPRISPPFLQR